MVMNKREYNRLYYLEHREEKLLKAAERYKLKRCEIRQQQQDYYQRKKGTSGFFVIEHNKVIGF